MNPIDRKNLASATLLGDYRTMSRVALAQRAILSTLRDSDLELGDFRRDGLMLALDELAGLLEERAGFLEEEGLVGGGES
ncbi:hypothetical protein [Halomonas mongoliensis]|uniref:hypothetical protein n=1 Tax=Halomonas mongoliensis TaxID=321265 RepID=UPI00403A9B21